MPSKEAPVSLRLPEPLRNRVAEYAARHELAYHRALVLLIEAGLTGLPTSAKPGRKAKPAVEKPAAAEEPKRRTGGTSFCEHRVPIGSFCSRCSGMH